MGCDGNARERPHARANPADSMQNPINARSREFAAAEIILLADDG